MRTVGMRALSVTLMASAMPCVAAAQSAEPQASAVADGSEIVVTARRREEVLSKVPIAITAIDPDTIASKSLQNENDLQAAVPGLVIKQSGSQNAFNYVIRGQTIDTYTNSPPGVLPYINEAQVVTYSASTFYDLGGIQVLKGPQGTLFGRNTTGGAVLFQTARPTDDFGGYIKGRYGRFDAYQVDGAINLPISDAIKLRIAASKTGGNAYIRRLDNGKRYGNLEQESVRGTLLIEPAGSGFKNTLVVQHTSDGGTNAPASAYKSSFFACGAPGGYTQIADCSYQGYPYGLAPGSSPFLSRGVAGLSQAQLELGPYTVIGQNTSLRHRAKSTFAINTTEYELSSSMTLKNIFMYNRSWSDEKNDYDGSPFPLIGVQGKLTPDLTTQTDEGVFYNRAEQYSNELQLQGEAADGKLDYTLGVYYMHQDNLFDSQVAFFNFFPLFVYGPGAPSFFPIHYIQESKNESIAGFAQVGYKLTDRLNLTAGLRYTRDKTVSQQLPGSDWYGCVPAVCGAAGVGPAYRQSVSTSKPSWNVSLDFQATPSLLLYVTTRGSWRAGGFNYSLAPNPAPASAGGSRFLPETTWDVEGGIKYNGRDLGFPVTFNLAVYNQVVKNIQRGANLRSPVTGTSILTTISVPEARITGFEADFDIRPADWLNLGGSLVYTDARFTRNLVTVPGNPPLVYGPYADVPKWSGTLYGEVSHELAGEGGRLALRGDFYFQSMTYFGNLGQLIPGTDLPAYQLIGARLSWSEIMGSGVTASLYGRNLANKRYYTGGNPTGLSGGFNTAFPGFPRMYGAEVKVAF